MATQMQNNFYKALRARGVFVNQPDMYFYQGGNKDAMGNNEVYSADGMLM